MSLFLGHSPKLFIRKHVLVRAAADPSSSPLQTPPCYVDGAKRCGPDHAVLRFAYTSKDYPKPIKKAPVELVYNDINDPITPWMAEKFEEGDKVSDAAVTTIGSSHGWVASLMHGVGILSLHDDLNPVASDANPKRILLPPLVTVPHCQTQIITNVSLSSLSPEEEDCVVAVKFLGPQLSFCRPASQTNSEWFNIKIDNPCFSSSRVMFSKRLNMFRMLGSGGHLIGSLDLCDGKRKLKFQELQYHYLPEPTEAEREVMDTCLTSEHLVESPSTGETFLVKCFRQTVDGKALLQTKGVMVFMVSPRGNAVYTQDIGDFTIFISKSEAFCVRASSFPGVRPNHVYILDVMEISFFKIADSFITTLSERIMAPYFIPPQNIEY